MFIKELVRRSFRVLYVHDDLRRPRKKSKPFQKLITKIYNLGYYHYSGVFATYVET